MQGVGGVGGVGGVLQRSPFVVCPSSAAPLVAPKFVPLDISLSPPPGLPPAPRPLVAPPAFPPKPCAALSSPAPALPRPRVRLPWENIDDESCARRFCPANPRLRVARRRDASQVARQSDALEALLRAQAQAPVSPGLDTPGRSRPECAVCMDSAPAVLLPCGHNLLCRSCVDGLVARASFACPTCRVEFDVFADLGGDA